tara:strand:+ start:1894 stop:2064 length:171 start_codon:yes stop_codon:yes gene_type:complete
MKKKVLFKPTLLDQKRIGLPSDIKIKNETNKKIGNKNIIKKNAIILLITVLQHSFF